MSSLRLVLMSALRKRYEADIEAAQATIELYLTNSVGVGEHPQVLEEIDKQVSIVAEAEEKLQVMLKMNPNG